jgi:multisubunit Na+/H+ antiporter MnhB subunit
MKKNILICGIILIVAALLCFAFSYFNYWLGGAVKDASNDFYHKVSIRSSLFLKLGIGITILGIAAFIIGIFAVKESP